MAGFRRCLARFKEDEGELGEFARFVADNPHITYVMWLVEEALALAPGVGGHQDGPVGTGHPFIPALTAAWERYGQEMAGATEPVGPDADPDGYEALRAAVEEGEQEDVLARLARTELDDGQRASLVTRTTDVRLSRAWEDSLDARYIRSRPPPSSSPGTPPPSSPPPSGVSSPSCPRATAAAPSPKPPSAKPTAASPPHSKTPRAAPRNTPPPHTGPLHPA